MRLCPSCDALHNRDPNAAISMYRVGASTLGVEAVRSAQTNELCRYQNLLALDMGSMSREG